MTEFRLIDPSSVTDLPEVIRGLNLYETGKATIPLNPIIIWDLCNKRRYFQPKSNVVHMYEASHLVARAIWWPDRLTPGTARVNEVAVRREFRRQGIGEGLMNQIEANVVEAGLRRISLISVASAIPFYDYLGYTALDDSQWPEMYKAVGSTRINQEMQVS